MTYIKCPDYLRAAHLRFDRLFLAGGISGCGDWQTKMKELLKDERIVVVNPRRENFDKNKISDEEQITWERSHLHNCNLISFWFPKETVCPITLLEFGYWLSFVEFNYGPFVDKKIFVGCEEGYSRRNDLIEQIKLSNKRKIIAPMSDSIEGLTNQVISHIHREQ